MSLATSVYTPEPLFTRRAYRRNMARAAKAFSAISMGAAFVLTTGEAGAQTARASAESGFSPMEGTPLGFNEDGDLRVLLASGEETVIPRGSYGLVGDQIMVSDLISGVEVAQNGYLPQTSGGAPVYGNNGFGYATWLVPLALVAGGVLLYILITRANNDAPAFGSASYTANFNENATGTVTTVAATDGEGDTITYSLSGDDAGNFSIDASGNITFNDAPNFEAPGDAGFNNVYNFLAVATDDHGEASSVPVTITVVDLVDAATDIAAATFTGTAAAEDRTNSVATTSIDMGAGNDSLDLQAGVTSGTVDMGAGNDKLLLSAGTVGAGATLDLGTGNDQLEIDIDTGANDFTINLGGGNDLIDIDLAQSAKTITVSNFSSGDKIDVAGVATYATYDAGPFGSAILASGGAGATEVTSYFDAGTGHTHVYFNDGANIMEMILQSYSDFSASDLVLT